MSHLSRDVAQSRAGNSLVRRPPLDNQPPRRSSCLRQSGFDWRVRIKFFFFQVNPLGLRIGLLQEGFRELPIAAWWITARRCAGWPEGCQREELTKQRLTKKSLLPAKEGPNQYSHHGFKRWGSSGSAGGGLAG